MPELPTQHLKPVNRCHRSWGHTLSATQLVKPTSANCIDGMRCSWNTTFEGHSRSSAVTLFDRSYTISYVVTICVSSCQWRFWGFHFGGRWDGDTFIWGHTTNTFALNYRVCNIILTSGGLILNFFGGHRGPEISLGCRGPLVHLGTTAPASCIVSDI